MNYVEKNGFTLIELFIVIGIISVLAMAVVITVNPGQMLADARDSQRKVHVEAIYSAVEQKIFTDGGWHDCPDLPTDNFTSIGTENYNLFSCLVPTYMSSEVLDPTEGTTADTQYAIWKNTQTGRVAVRAKNSETESISAGEKGGALDFDGVDDYVEVPHSDNFTGETISWAFWIKRNSYTKDGGPMAKHQAASGLRSWNIRQADNDSLEMTLSDDGETFDGISSGAGLLEDNKWIFIAIVYDAGDITFYKDGAYFSDTIATKKSLFNNTGQLVTIGSYLDYLNGSMDDVRIYNRALSESEVEKLYYGNHITEGLVGHWPMNEMEGCVAGDYGGNNDGTLQPDCPTNAPEWTTGR